MYVGRKNPEEFPNEPDAAANRSDAAHASKTAALSSGEPSLEEASASRHGPDALARSRRTMGRDLMSSVKTTASDRSSVRRHQSVVHRFHLSPLMFALASAVASASGACVAATANARDVATRSLAVIPSHAPSSSSRGPDGSFSPILGSSPRVPRESRATAAATMKSTTLRVAAGSPPVTLPLTSDADASDKPSKTLAGSATEEAS
mmetsp:Transcript_4039/g.16529  ORF Transcript_4039/g.16529 Transcript_4039/m.16529 type:complete len:206 (-) Transcript_4039:93-710(-)